MFAQFCADGVSRGSPDAGISFLRCVDPLKCCLQEIPISALPSFGPKLKNLTEVTAHKCRIEVMALSWMCDITIELQALEPAELEGLTALTTLTLHGNMLSSIPGIYSGLLG